MPGQTFNVEIRKTRSGAAGSGSGGSTTSAVRRVLEADHHGFLMEWTFGATKVMGAQRPSGSAIELASNFDGLRLEILLDPHGRFAGLQNEETTMVNLRRALDGMIRNAALPFPESQRAAIAESLRSMVTPESEFDQMKRVIHLVFDFYGIAPSRDNAAHTVDVENPLGADMPPSAMTYSLKQLDPKAERAEVFVEHMHGIEFLGTIIGDLLLKAGAGTEFFQSIGSTNVVDKTNFSYNTGSGYIQEIRHQRLITTGSLTQEDHIDITINNTSPNL
jgi:hypothetical protein